jgi:hypothetical protein
MSRTAVSPYTANHVILTAPVPHHGWGGVIRTEEAF